ncbi:MAG: hypothetical protein ABL983_10345 [Nitrospira sp.]
MINELLRFICPAKHEHVSTEEKQSQSHLTEQGKQNLTTYHATIAEQLDSRMAESPKFFGVVVVALTAYAYAIWHWVPNKDGSTLVEQGFMLGIVSMLAYLVVLWAVSYLAALSYAFRFLQYSMHKAEDELGWKGFRLSDAERMHYGCVTDSFRLLPGIYHAHLAGLFFVMIFICFVFSHKWAYYCREAGERIGCLGESRDWVYPGVFLLFGTFWFVFVNRHYMLKYVSKIKEREIVPASESQAEIKKDELPSGDCPEKWKLDVNDRYQKAVGIVISLSTGSLAIPILFLKDLVVPSREKTIVALLDGFVYWGWALLSTSILSGILYCFFSAKWAKRAWKKDADILGLPVGDARIERLLDRTYFLMMFGFVVGLACMVKFVATYVFVSSQKL